MTPEEIAAVIEPPTKEQVEQVAKLAAVFEGDAPAPPAPAPDPSTPVFNEAAIGVIAYGSEFRIMETVMTLSQLSLTRKPEYRAARVVMFCRSDSYDSKSKLLFLTGRIAVGSGEPLYNTSNSPSIIEASIHRAVDAIEVRRHFTANWFVGLLHEPTLAKEPKRRRYNIESVLGSTIIELARLAPMNPTLRSHLTAIFHIPPPPEADTYQKLKDWMEFEFEAPFLDGVRKQHYGINPPRNSSAPINPQHAAAFEVKITLKGKQIGACRYIADATQEVLKPVSKAHMTQWVRDGYSLRDILNNVIGRFSIETQVSFETAEITNHVYSDHVYEDVEGVTRAIDEATVQKLIEDYLRRTYGPKEAQEIIDRQ